MTKNDGGSAFPRNHEPATITRDGYREYHTPFVHAQQGMSLRDYAAVRFAAVFLHGAVFPTERDREEGFASVAKVSYDMADAMLKERDK